MSDKKPAIPSAFPSDLKELVTKGWSKEPKKRPLIQDFKLALNTMQTGEEKGHSLTLPEEKTSTNMKKEHQAAHDEVVSAQNTKGEFQEAADPAKKTEASTEAGEQLFDYFL
jgi:hypothetical protein